MPGGAQIQIDRLVSALGVTKGSFYWQRSLRLRPLSGRLLGSPSEAPTDVRRSPIEGAYLRFGRVRTFADS